MGYKRIVVAGVLAAVVVGAGLGFLGVREILWPPRVKYQLTANLPSLTKVIERNLAEAPYWLCYAKTTEARSGKLEISAEGKHQLDSHEGGKIVTKGDYEEGDSCVTITIRSAGTRRVQMFGGAQTPPMLWGVPTPNPQEAAFEAADRQAVDDIMPYLCGRLIRETGDQRQADAMLDWVGKEWPGDRALMALRGLGPLGKSYADRAEQAYHAKIAETGYGHDELQALLAVDEARAVRIMMGAAPRPGEDHAEILNQHLELQPQVESASHIGSLGILGQSWSEELTEEGARAIEAFASRYPNARGKCVELLQKYPATNARAAAMLQRLK